MSIHWFFLHSVLSEFRTIRICTYSCNYIDTNDRVRIFNASFSGKDNIREQNYLLPYIEQINA